MIESFPDEKPEEVLARVKREREEDEQRLKHKSDFEPDDLADVLYDITDNGLGEAFPWPFDELNRLTFGGMRKGELVVIAGHSSHGKSHFVDQVLDRLHENGNNVRLYMNEMAVAERLGRRVQRQLGVPYGDLMRGRLSEDQKKKIVDYCNEGVGWGITFIPGWSAEKVAHHIEVSHWDVAAIDILHRFDYQDERDLSKIVERFAAVALRTDTCIILVCHLNEGRIGYSKSPIRPKPVLGDLRGSGNIKNHADQVIFVHREQEETKFDSGETGPVVLLNTGWVYFAKTRNGILGGMRTRWDDDDLRFHERMMGT